MSHEPLNATLRAPLPPPPRRLPMPLRRVGRACFRSYGSHTARLRPLPEFLLVGAKRSGTTSLYFHLLHHPQILPMFPEARYLPKVRDGKGPHFFDSEFHRGPDWYRGHFPSVVRRRSASRQLGLPVVCGEASPYYLYHPLAPRRAASLVPDARILVLLRDPVERTHSHYREQVRNGVEKLAFEAALAEEERRTAGEEERLERDPLYRSHAHEQQSYRRQSEYARGLRRWTDSFPREHVLVLFSEEYYADPARTCSTVFEFLGLSGLDLRTSEVLNAAPTAPMASGTRESLRRHFAPHNDALAQLVGRPLPWPT